jgi:hypothetical protein
MARTGPNDDDPWQSIHGRPQRPGGGGPGESWRTGRVRSAAPRVLMALKVNWAFPSAEPTGRAAWSPIEPSPLPHRPRRIGPPTTNDSRDAAHAVRRAHDAILGAADALPYDHPTLATALRSAAIHGQPRLMAPLLGAWKMRTSGGPDHVRRFPWSLGHDATPAAAVEARDGHGALWRPRERDWLDREPTAFGHRLVGPIAIAENLELLAELVEDANPEIARTAGEILRDVQPLVEGEVADFIRGDDPWRDTFALWLLVSRPRALELLRPLTMAIATRAGTLASRLAGLPCGTRFPFEAVPLVSASAHLGLSPIARRSCRGSSPSSPTASSATAGSPTRVSRRMC